MTIRQDILKAISRADNLLGDSINLVVDNLYKQINPDGGFKARDVQSDLYYTVFGIEALLGLNAELPQERIKNYLKKFSDIDSLDFVDLTCLARCWADLSQSSNTDLDNDMSNKIIRCIENYRSGDGGYSNTPDAQHATTYGCFLALGAYQDLNINIQDSDAFIKSVQSLQTPDGSFANERVINVGTTPSTAAALTILHYFHIPPSKSSTDWLLSRVSNQGGFVALPHAPVADLLSTAVALHALTLSRTSIDTIKTPCLEYINTLWDSQGTFYSNSIDKVADCEYTFYGLLALGHLIDQ